MNGTRFVVATGDVDELLAGGDVVVIDRAPNAVLVEATPSETLSLQGRGGTHVSVFRNPAIARTAFGLYER